MIIKITHNKKLAILNLLIILLIGQTTFVYAQSDGIKHILTVKKTGHGTGIVTNNYPGIDCGNDCNEAYNYGIYLTLTATPDNTSLFEGWLKEGGGYFNEQCTYLMTCSMFILQDNSIVAKFSLFGDMNEDGLLNIFDIQKLINCISRTDTCCTENGDMNKDSRYNILDIQQLIVAIFRP